jgi:hypothetical protein
MKIYKSTEYIENPKIGDLRLEVNSKWDFGSRSVCFETIKNSFGGGSTIIGFDLEECIDVKDGIIIGGTEKVKNTQWKQAEINKDIIKQLEDDGYSISQNFIK